MLLETHSHLEGLCLQGALHLEADKLALVFGGKRPHSGLHIQMPLITRCLRSPLAGDGGPPVSLSLFVDLGEGQMAKEEPSAAHACATWLGVTGPKPRQEVSTWMGAGVGGEVTCGERSWQRPGIKTHEPKMGVTFFYFFP